MYKNLNMGLLGHSVSFEDTIALAQRYGFSGIDLDCDFLDGLVRARGMDAARSWFAATGLRAGGFSVKTPWREGDADADFERGLAQLDAHAALARAFGSDRGVTWVMPCSNTLSYREHYARVAPRLARVAATLAKHGARLGLEFVGPATLRATRAHDFVHTLDGMRAFNCAIGGAAQNTGLLLDCFHWWTAHATEFELQRLSRDEIVYVHVNDARAGLGPDEQIDNQREQAGATGAIPLQAFMRALRNIGYDGPVASEPFNAAIKAMTPDEAARTTSAALDRAMAA